MREGCNGAPNNEAAPRNKVTRAVPMNASDSAGLRIMITERAGEVGRPSFKSSSSSRKNRLFSVTPVNVERTSGLMLQNKEAMRI